MKRSMGNRILRDAEAFVASRGFALPPFARWTPDELRAQAPAALFAGRLGWDVTDFGTGDFECTGLVLVTLHNGTLAGPRTYAEKLLVVRRGQRCPLHRHHRKVEDIIARGGVLGVELYMASADGRPDRSAEVRVEVDATERLLPPGGPLRLEPGESVTLHPDHWHAFWAEGGDLLAGEVSTVNDDASDNWFAEPLGRFAAIEEDEPAYRLLVADYPT